MLRAVEFPILAELTSSHVKIYSFPQQSKEGKSYPSFLVVHYLEGARKRLRFNDLNKAQERGSSHCYNVSVTRETYLTGL